MSKKQLAGYMSRADRRERRRQMAAEMRAGATPADVARRYGVTLGNAREARAEFAGDDSPPSTKGSA